jgi:pimeloyl-ACP methyl ester carboxylesterase
MNDSSNSLTLVLIHGAFADASSWVATYDELKGDGMTITAPPVPLRGIASDADYLRSKLDQIEGEVVLVGHSYGGAVITAAGDHEKVKALVYIAGYAPDQGESLGQLQGQFPDSPLAAALVFTPLPDGDQDVSVDPAKFPDIFAADVPREQTEFLAISQRPLAASVFEEPAPSAAWKTKPSYGLIPTADNTINPEVHKFGFERAGMTTVEVEGASHAVALSKPREVADLVRKAVADLAG